MMIILSTIPHQSLLTSIIFSTIIPKPNRYLIIIILVTFVMLTLLFVVVFQSNPYALKEGGGEMSAWTSAGLQPSGGYYPYDPTLAAYG